MSSLSPPPRYESQPTSTSLGLGPAAAAPTLSARVASSSSVASSRDTVGSPSPPKPPRLIHYASRSKEDWDRLARSGGSYPHVGAFAVPSYIPNQQHTLN